MANILLDINNSLVQRIILSYIILYNSIKYIRIFIENILIHQFR